MKKLLLLLLIAPIIGNSQMLNVPVSGVIVLQGFELNNTTVPQGKIWQWTGISTYDEQTPTNEGLFYGEVHWDTHYGGFVSKYHFFKENQNMTVSFPGNWDCQDCYFTFIEYDINAQPLAYNAPEKIKPTLYPNPTTSKIALNSDKEYQIEVYDMAGNKVMELTGNTIDVSHLSASTYIVRALDKANDEEVSYKIVKN